MSDLGSSVYSAVEFLTGFYKDVSRLVTAVEERMGSQGLAHLYGTTAFWKRSYTYYAPGYWMPRWVARWYTEKMEDGAKGEERAPWFAFFNVYFTPRQIEEPVAVWGFGAQDSAQSLGIPLSELLVAEEGPRFLVEVPVTEWEGLEEIPEPLSAFQYRARAVVELEDARTVEELVTAPLLAEVARLRKSL